MDAKKKLSEKISLAKCREILCKKGKTYTDEQLLKIRDFLFELAQIDYDVFIYNDRKEKLLQTEKKKDDESDFKNAA